MNAVTNHEKLSTTEIQEKVKALGEWFHNFDFNGVQTAPHHFLGNYPTVKWVAFAHSIPSDLSGRTVLDIGCNAGFYSIEMKRRGAKRVLGIDSDDDYLAQARFAAEMMDTDIEFRKCSVYDIEKIGEKFDYVLFMGVLYHLRHPLLALDLISEHVAKDVFIFQSMLRGNPIVQRLENDYPFAEKEIFEKPGFPKMYFIENSYAGDQTNWWIPNRSCVEAMIRSCGFRIMSHPENEVFICRKSGPPRTG